MMQNIEMFMRHTAVCGCRMERWQCKNIL